MNIDTNILNNKSNEIRDVVSNLEDILEDIKKDTNNLKPVWDSKVSSEVYASFEDFYKDLQNVCDTLNEDINYLDNVVSSNYKSNEQQTNNSIDDKIDVNI